MYTRSGNTTAFLKGRMITGTKIQGFEAIQSVPK
jgi:hypothetical protein